MADNETSASLNNAEMPAVLRDYLAKKQAGEDVGVTLDAMLPGAEFASARDGIAKNGFAEHRTQDGKNWLLVGDTDEHGNVMGLAAGIARNPGRAYDALQQLSDFQDDLMRTDSSDRKDALALFHRLYRGEGIINNALNKMAAIVAVDGSFKVRSVKGQRGKSGDKAAGELQTALNWWKDKVNTRGQDAVITGDRGIRAFISRGARMAFIEGDHIGRHFWPKKKAVIPNLKPFTMPLNLQTFSAQHIFIPKGLEGTNYEVLYWQPPKTFVQLLQNPTDPILGKYLQKTIPSDVKSALINDGMYPLDPELSFHIKHRGTGVETFGESVVEATLPDVRYKRALDALEITTITNLINRLVIIKVGSDNKESVYHKQEVSAKRLGMLQRIIQRVGPSAMVLWPGPDIEVVEASAHNAILELDGRYKIAERRLLMALGVPAVLMIGEGNDGKAAGFAAALGIAAQLVEIQNQYKDFLENIAEQIADQNGYEEVDVVWEWHNNVLEDKAAAAELILKMFDRGLLDTESAMEELGFDYGAVVARQEADVTNGYKDQAFGPPPSAQTSNVQGANQGGSNNGGGRPTKQQNPTPDPRSNKETAPTQDTTKQ